MLNYEYRKIAPRSAEATELFQALSNEWRFLILCNLLNGERSVTELAALVDISQSALSQHLAKLRGMKLVTTRRAGHQIFYRLASTEVEEVISALYGVFCPETGTGPK